MAWQGKAHIFMTKHILLALACNIVWGSFAFAQSPNADMIDLSQAAIFSAPSDIASWPITESIIAMTERPTDSALAGLSFSTVPILPERWKQILDAQGDNFQFTVWACAQTPVWTCAGFIQMWQGRPNTGAPMLSDFHRNWAYDAGRWGPLNNYIPKAGDIMAFFLSAGNARGEGGVTSVRERSNVVTFQLPASDFGDAIYSVAPVPIPAPAPIPEPVPVPPVVTPPAPLPVPVPAPAPLPSTPVVTPPIPTPPPATSKSTLAELIITIVGGIISVVLAAVVPKLF